MMQRLGAKYVANINRLHQRTGTLWEGRFKSSLVDSHEYCLACYRYIELNPVRAGIVNHPAEYPWTSYRSNTGLEFSSSISPHPQWLALGQSDRQRFSAYESLVAQALSEDKIEQIRYNVSKGLPTGSKRFKAEVESALAIKLGDGKRGRPWIKVDKGVRAL